MMTKKCILLFSPLLFVFFFSMAQNQQPPKPPSQEERLKQVSEKITKEIKLSTAQKAKVEAAYKDFFVDVEKLRAKNGNKEMPPPPPPGSKEDMDKLSKARDAKIKSALTETQYTKYVEMEASLRPPKPDGMQPPPPGNKKG